MKKHTEIYMKAYGLDETDFVGSELSGLKCQDVHHIDCKGMGGDPKGDKDRIENLQALTRFEHVLYGDKKKHMKMLYEEHLNHLEIHGVKFDRKYLEDKIKSYD